MRRTTGFAIAVLSALWCAFASAAAPYVSVQGGARVEHLPLLDSALDVTISGVVADVRLTQTYENRGSTPIEAIYVFPGSARAAVYAATLTIGTRTIVAQIREKQAARAEYAQARAEGKTATLLEQIDPASFRMNVANVLPGDRIRVDLRYTELLVPTDGTYEFFFPNTFSPVGAGAAGQTTSAEPEVTDYAFNAHVKLVTGVPLQTVESPSHRVDIARNADGADVVLSPDERHAAQSDFRLQYRLAGGEIETGLLVAPGADENYFLLVAQPPAQVDAARVLPREFVFVVDVSGSMLGRPLALAQSLMTDLLRTLRPTDRFNIILFSGGNKVLSPQGSLPVTPGTADTAEQFMHSGFGGGATELLPALEAAYALPRTAGMSRSIVVVTDGEIEAGGPVFRSARRHLSEANLFAFGIGDRVNRPIIENMARGGMGEPFVVADFDQGSSVAAQLRRYIDRPVLSHIAVDFGAFQAYDVEPPALPDLLAQRPIVLVGKYRGTPTGTLAIQGIAADAPRRIELHAESARVDRSAALRNLWARTRIARLLDENLASYGVGAQDAAAVREITDLGLRYGLLTPYTSFLAQTTESRTNAASTPVSQPAPARAGWGSPLSLARTLAVEVASTIAPPPPADAAQRTVQGKSFARGGAWWSETAAAPATTTLRIRVGSAAYRRLLALDPRIAAWAALGERVRLRYGDVAIELAPVGFEDYPEAQLRRALGRG